jgi:hypothetical protein
VPPEELTPERAIEISGLDSQDPRVLALATRDMAGITLIDPNGDGHHLETEHVERDGRGRWVGGSSSGGGAFDVEGVHGWGEYSGTPGSHMLAIGGRYIEVTTADNGRWVSLDPGPGD